MATPKKQNKGQKGAVAPTPSTKPPRVSRLDQPFPTWAKVGAALLLCYLMVLLIFPQNVFHHYDFAFGGDNLAAAPIAKMGQDFEKEGYLPQWCPYILGGMPTVGSLLYANQFYPGFFLGEALTFLFFGSSYSWLFLHFLLAGLGVFLILQDLKVHWWLAVICSLFFAFNPTMGVFADVGHGSKLMTIAYLPWILYFTKRLYDRPTVGRSAWLALGFGLQLLALHVQIAYYGAMLMGLYAVFAFLAGGKEALKSNVRATLLLGIAGLLAFGLAAPLYLQVQEYSHFSIRGGGTSGGASWDYATAWSFHPLESLTYVFPSFFGFGGDTYWGFMPFTDMPLYWGGVILLFLPWAILLKRDKITYFLIILALLAWIVSFGKFLPLLFGPLFKLLPYFNKFRVPSLIQVLVLLPVVVLGGRGLQSLWEAIRGKKEQAERLSHQVFKIGAIAAGVCLLLLVLQGALRPTFIGWMHGARPQLSGNSTETAFALFTGDLIRLLLLIVVLYGSAWLALKQKGPWELFVLAVAIAAILELNYFNKRLVHPTPPQQMEAYLQPTDVVKFLQSQHEPFRILPMTGGRSPDWYMPFRIESVMGYTGAKPRLFQNALDTLTYNNFNLLRLLNTQFFISDKPLAHEDFEEVFVGRSERVYRYKKALPRAFLVNRVVSIPSSSEILDLYKMGRFDFSKMAALESPLPNTLEAEATGQVTWVKRTPDHLTLEVESSGRQLLVLSEPYYPSGWEATLDGKGIPIYKADYLFRGVEIPSGKHHLEMTFQPKSARLGQILKWISLVIILLGFGYAILPAMIKKPNLAVKS